MTLSNDTLYRGYLAHVRSNIRRLSQLHFERDSHPDAKDKPRKPSESLERMREMWESLRRDTMKVIHVQLLPFNRLAGSGDIIQSYSPPPGASNQGDPLRVTLGVLKKAADKARRKDPSIKLMKSWDKVST